MKLAPERASTCALYVLNDGSTHIYTADATRCVAMPYLEEVPLFDKQPGCGDEAGPSELLLQLVHLHKKEARSRASTIYRNGR